MKLGTWTVLLWLELVGVTALTAWAQGPGATSIPIKLKDGYLEVAKVILPVNGAPNLVHKGQQVWRTGFLLGAGRVQIE